MGAQSSLNLPARRLLTLAEAASYCGVTSQVFERTCPIPAISLAPPGRDDRRLHRYDVVQLNGWIDLLSGRVASDPFQKDWLKEMDG